MVSVGGNAMEQFAVRSAAGVIARKRIRMEQAMMFMREP